MGANTRRRSLAISALLGAISDTALTRDDRNGRRHGLPNTFVPGRNLVFLTFAAAIAYRRGLKHIVGGMCETDFSGYPDCRDDTIKALQVALNLGMESRFVLETPLMWLDKAQTWALAEELGGAALVTRSASETPHLLCRRARRAPCLGPWLRRMSSLPVAGGGF